MLKRELFAVSLRNSKRSEHLKTKRKNLTAHLASNIGTRLDSIDFCFANELGYFKEDLDKVLGHYNSNPEVLVESESQDVFSPSKAMKVLFLIQVDSLESSLDTIYESLQSKNLN